MHWLGPYRCIDHEWTIIVATITIATTIVATIIVAAIAKMMNQQVSVGFRERASC